MLHLIKIHETANNAAIDNVLRSVTELHKDTAERMQSILSLFAQEISAQDLALQGAAHSLLTRATAMLHGETPDQPAEDAQPADAEQGETP